MKIRDLVAQRISIIIWQLLRRLRIFRFWYKRFLNELMFDLQLCDIEKERTTAKYQAKLDRANAV